MYNFFPPIFELAGFLKVVTHDQFFLDKCLYDKFLVYQFLIKTNLLVSKRLCCG